MSACGGFFTTFVLGFDLWFFFYSPYRDERVVFWVLFVVLLLFWLFLASLKVAKCRRKSGKVA